MGWYEHCPICGEKGLSALDGPGCLRCEGWCIGRGMGVFGFLVRVLTGVEFRRIIMNYRQGY